MSDLVIDFVNHTKYGYLDYTSAEYDKSDADSFNIPVTLYQSLNFNLTIPVVFSGGHSDKENYGVGKHYTITESTNIVTSNSAYDETTVLVTIPAGSTVTNIPVTIYNNLVYQCDANGLAKTLITVSSNNLASSKTITINDDNVNAAIYNVVTDYAVWGGSSGLVAGDEDEAANNNTKLVAIHDYFRTLSGWDATVDQVILYFPDGEYYFAHNVDYLWAGISHVGESRSGTILRRPSKTWYVNNSYPTADGGRYWYPVFRWLSTGTYWDDSVDSKATGFRRMSFDGAYDTFWPFTPYTCFEPSHMIYVSKSSDSAGMMLFILEDITFANNITGDFAEVSNVKGLHYHITHELPALIGKGDYSFVGGNMYSRYRDVVGGRQIDFEQNGPTSGYYGDSRMDIELTDVYAPQVQGGLDDTATGTQTVIFNNCEFEKISVGMGAADVQMNDCIVNAHVYGSTKDNLFSSAKTFIADGCTWNLYEGTRTDRNGLEWVGGNYGDWVWEFINCVFNKIGTWTYESCAFCNPGDLLNNRPGEYQSPSSSPTLRLEDCEFNDFDWVAYVNGGGIVEFIRPKTVNCLGLASIYGTATNSTNDTFSSSDVNTTDNTIFSTEDFGEGYPVRLYTDGTLPAPLKEWYVEQQLYYTKNQTEVETPSTGYTYQLSLTRGGSAVDLSDGGTGTHTLMSRRLYYCTLSVEGPVDFDTNLATYVLIRGTSTLAADNRIEHIMDGSTPTVILPEAQAEVVSEGSTYKGYSFIGHRRITGSAGPTSSITGMPEDEYYDTDTSTITHTVNYDNNESFTSSAVDTVNNKLTLTNDYGSNQAVRFTTDGTLPAPLVAYRTYYTIRISATEFQLASTSGGVAINLTDTGGVGDTHHIYDANLSAVGYRNDGEETYVSTTWTAV